VRSAPGKGATFVVRLPRVSGRTPAAAVTPETGPGSGAVLLVEDQDDVREVVADMLRA